MLKDTLASVKRPIQQAEDAMPATIVNRRPAHIDHAIILVSLTSEGALEKPEIGSTDPVIPIQPI